SATSDRWPEASPAPLRTDGVDAEPWRCKCGAAAHPEHEDRCSRGHPRTGNTLAVVVGQHSAAFWASVEHVQRELRLAMLRDRGVTEAEAPAALVSAIDGAVQAILLRDSAFLHVAASGGPTTLRGRRRAAFNVWREASDRVVKYLQLVGLERRQ